jgi:hypothetical protein
MPDTLITNLTSGNPAQSGDELVINRGGADRKVTAGSIAALASGGGLPLQLPIQDGAYYSSPGDELGSFSLGDWGPDYLFAIPVIFGEARTWTKIGINCTSENAGDVMRLGIYADNGGTPVGGALVLDAGEVDLSTTGEKEKDISQALAGFEYVWLAGLLNGSTALITGINNSTLWSWVGGRTSPTGRATFELGFIQAYGALPATFPSADDGSASIKPYIWLRTGV